jgi:cytochrome c-type biogenesis protein CcmE
LTEIYPTYDDRLILFGVLENGERIAIQIQEMDRNIYFVLKSDQLTEAKQEIDRRLRAAGINKF